MIRLRVLGATELRDADGRELRSVLAQPKRLALLVYLAATPDFHRRDTLLALFWPELDAPRAREALNQAVRFLRKELGGSPSSVLVGRGSGELGVEAGALWCDLRAFREHVAGSRYGEALDLYRGDLLPGFFAEQSAGFEEWLDTERTQLRAAAARAAREVAESRERAAKYTGAVVAARRAVELAGLDERAVRNLLSLLDRLGDRAGAIHAFEEFAGRLATELEAEPAAETQALIAQIRQRAAVSPLFSPPVSPSGEPGRAAVSPLAGLFASPTESTPTDDASPLSPGAPAKGDEGLRIVRELGRGATATVYLAHDPKHDRKVALKILHPELTTWIGTERFLREIQITAQLAHPHVLPLIDSGSRDGQPYLVTPYVAGETLRARLERERRLPLGDALRLAGEIAEALDYAHRCGIVHRDVKPENVLLADGHALVADFGIARAIASAESARVPHPPRHLRPTPTGVVLGTLSYMSPEARSGVPVDAQADIFALGCMLVEMLSGKLPESGMSATALARKHALPSRGVARLAAACVATDPTERPRGAGEVARRLERLAVATAAPARRRRRAVLGTGLGGGVVAAVALAALLGERAPWRSGAERTATLDTTRWAVMPSEASAAGAAELVREAFGKWTGISVVDGADVREAQRRLANDRRAGEPLTALARLVGAGRVVRVDVARVGDSVSIQQSLYDGATRRLLANGSVRLAGDLSRADAALASVAERLLFPGETPSALGGSRSSSVPARLAFARGRRAADEWRLALADSQFRHATELDADDAHAWLWLALVRQWRGAPIAEWRFAAERAADGGVRLDDTERLAAGALVALARGERLAACGRWSELTRRAPEAFEGWFSLGQCLRYDSLVVRDRASPSGWRFRSSHQAALEAYERAFRIFPRERAEVGDDWFREMQKLIAPDRALQRVGVSDAPARVAFLAAPYARGDSIAYVPVPRDSIYAGRGVRATTDDATARGQRRHYYELARMWRARLSRSPAALEALANALDLLGSPSAIDTMVAARGATTDEHARVRIGAYEVFMRVRQSAPYDLRGVQAAHALADSLLARGGPLDPETAGVLAGLAALTGRAIDAARFARLAEARRTPVGIETSAPALVAFAALGGPPDSIRANGQAVERALAAAMSPAERAQARGQWLMHAELLAVPGAAWRATTPSPAPSSVPERQLAAWRARRAAVLDSLLVATRDFRRAQGITPADVMVDAAYYESAMLASVGRERRAAEWLDPVLDSLPRRTPAGIAGVAHAGPLVRAMALRADLAARAGDVVRARAWATTVLTLWAQADPHLRPTLDDMRRIVKR